MSALRWNLLVQMVSWGIPAKPITAKHPQVWYPLVTHMVLAKPLRFPFLASALQQGRHHRRNHEVHRLESQEHMVSELSIEFSKS